MIHERPVLCLSGFMGAGKSTVGALVAQTCRAIFTDLDTVIEEAAGKTVSQIFAEDGEARFRALERRELERSLTDPGLDTPRVMALGGGALVDASSRALALERAFVVTLTATEDEILRRTAASDARPLLARERVLRVRELMRERAHVYLNTHLLVDTTGRAPEEIAAELSKCWRPRRD